MCNTYTIEFHKGTKICGGRKYENIALKMQKIAFFKDAKNKNISREHACPLILQVWHLYI